MCSYKQLYRGRDGYVIKCRSCMNIQVGFGTTGLTLTPTQFHDLAVIVRRLYEAHRDYEFPDQKKVAIPTVSGAVSILCTVNELASFDQLLTRGKNIIEMAKLFVFNEN